MKVYKVHYDVMVDGVSFYGNGGESRHVIVRDDADARDAIDRLCVFVERSSFEPGRRATADDVTIHGVELVARDAIR